MNTENLAKTLVKRRSDLGITQKELAKHINYSDKVISKWERGESVPDIYALENIAGFYKITIDELINGTTTETITYSKPYQLFFEAIKLPPLIMKFSILLPIGLWILTFPIDIILTTVTAVPLIGLVILWGFFLAKSEWISNHDGHIFKIVTHGITCRVYLDNHLVDEVKSFFSNYTMSIKYAEDTIKIRVSQPLIKIHVFAVVE